MKVMCINENWAWKAGLTLPFTPPAVGDVCTVVNVKEDGSFYELEEYPPGFSFRIDHFAPLQDDPQPEEQIEELQTATA